MGRACSIGLSPIREISSSSHAMVLGDYSELSLRHLSGTLMARIRGAASQAQDLGEIRYHLWITILGNYLLTSFEYALVVVFLRPHLCLIPPRNARAQSDLLRKGSKIVIPETEKRVLAPAAFSIHVSEIILTFGVSPKGTFQERSTKEIVPSHYGNDDVSDRRSLTNPSLAPSIRSGGKRSQSIKRPPSGESVRQTGSIASEHPIQKENESQQPRLSSDFDWGDPDIAGQWSLDHHQHNLVNKSPYKTPSKGYLKRPQGAAPTSNNSRSETESTAGSRKKCIFTVSFAELQRMRLRKLQIKLVKQAVEMHHTGQETKDWEETLQQYSRCHEWPETASD